MDDSGIGSATTSNYFIPAGSVVKFKVESSKPYMRVIRAAAGSVVYVTEIY